MAPPDWEALMVEGNELLEDLKRSFLELPEDCQMRKPAQLQNGLCVDSWLGLLEYVLQKGAPEVVPSGARFALDVYGLESTLEMDGEAVHVHCIATEPTFFGNYAPPDDLDGQIIDLVATRCPSSARMQVKPQGLSCARDLARHAEVRAWQQKTGDSCTVKSLGVVPEDIANLNVTPGVEVNLALPGGGEVRKSPQQKVVLSDHLPIAFTVHWEDGERQHQFFCASMNMLAQSYLDFNFWNACPHDELEELWLLASRLRATADRKTKWLPREYSTLGRTPCMSDEELAVNSSPLISWERVNRSLWRWIFRVQREASKTQVAGNAMAPDAVRQGVFVQLLMSLEDSERPDLLLLQEFGLAELCSTDLQHLQEFLGKQRPMLRPLLECYEIVNLAPKLAVRRDWKCCFNDTGLLLAKKSLMSKYKFLPLNCAMQGQACKLQQIYTANAGKPIVGAQVQDLQGRPLANIFGVHAEKSKTEEILRGLFRFAASVADVPTLVVGDFNAVLRAPRESRESEKSICWEFLRTVSTAHA